MQCRYRLVGPHEGRSITLNGHRFIDGFTGWMDRPESDWLKIDVQMINFYSSVRETYTHGSAEGEGPIEVQLNGGGTETQATDESAGHDEATEGGSGVHPAEGGGPERPTDPVTLKEALDRLNPSVNEQWSRTGKPDLDYLSARVGRRVSRSEVDKVAPWMTRAYIAANLAEQR